MQVQFTIVFEDGSIDVRSGNFLGDTLAPGETVKSATITEGDLDDPVTYPMTRQGIDRAAEYAESSGD
jgi:hypothetical protein